MYNIIFNSYKFIIQPHEEIQKIQLFEYLLLYIPVIFNRWVANRKIYIKNMGCQ